MICVGKVGAVYFALVPF